MKTYTTATLKQARVIEAIIIRMISEYEAAPNTKLPYASRLASFLTSIRPDVLRATFDGLEVAEAKLCLMAVRSVTAPTNLISDLGKIIGGKLGK